MELVYSNCILRATVGFILTSAFCLFYLGVMGNVDYSGY